MKTEWKKEWCTKEQDHEDPREQDITITLRGIWKDEDTTGNRERGTVKG